MGPRTGQLNIVGMMGGAAWSGAGQGRGGAGTRCIVGVTRRVVCLAAHLTPVVSEGPFHRLQLQATTVHLMEVLVGPGSDRGGGPRVRLPWIQPSCHTSDLKSKGPRSLHVCAAHTSALPPMVTGPVGAPPAPAAP